MVIRLVRVMFVQSLPSTACFLYDPFLAPTSLLCASGSLFRFLEVTGGDGSSTLFGTGVLECMLSELRPTVENFREVIDSG